MTERQRAILEQFPVKHSKTAETGVRAVEDRQAARTPEQRMAKDAELRHRASELRAAFRR